MDELPSDFDVIVVGTGMTASIVAAALSRIGQSVLHIDVSDQYGENWGSCNLENMETWIENLETISNTTQDSCNYLIPVVPTKTISQAKRTWNVENHADVEWCKARLLEESRKFNLDLAPKVLYSCGPLVELLISSNIARYAEFRSLNRILAFREGQLEIVPCSRADVFASRTVSVIHKRMLVKILTLIHEYNYSETDDNQSFRDFLLSHKLPEQLLHYILYAIAIGDDEMSKIEGIRRCQKFINSLGRFGSTPFIVPMYGCGELPQCFCRLCAVFGGIYCLKRSVDSISLESKTKINGIYSDGNLIKAKHVVLSSSVCPEKFKMTNPTRPALARGIFITNKSILEDNQNKSAPATLLNFPTTSGHPITVIEVGSSCHVSPTGLFVVHMTTQIDDIDPKSALQPAISSLLSENGENSQMPNILWSFTWKFEVGVTGKDCPENLHICPSGPDPFLDYDLAISEAKEIFLTICPNEEFLPRAPDPEEIVLEDSINDEKSTIIDESLVHSQESGNEE